MTRPSQDGSADQAGDEEQAGSEHELIHRRLFEAHRLLLVSHLRPDGDAIGSLLGLGLALTQAGKEVRMVLEDGLPVSFRHLEGGERISRSVGDIGNYDCVIVLDCSDLRRAGAGLDGRVPDINIDHHITNLKFAEINLVLPKQVATSAIVAQYLSRWGLGYNKAISAALLTGIVTDTLGFRTVNVTPEALRLAAMLMEKGANLHDLYRRGLVVKTVAAARYWGQGLGRLQMIEADDGYRLVWTTLTLEDRQTVQYPGNDDADLVNILSSIDSDVAIIFVEQKNSRVKVSWRARPGIDVAQIALQFGGGGHAAASGAEISGTLETVQQLVLDATRTMLDQAYGERNGNKPGLS